MTDFQTSPGSLPNRPKLSIPQNQSKDTLEIKTDKGDDEVILASNSDGSSLTLLEEYSIRKNSYGKLTALITFFCAAASITFAFMIFKTL